MNEFLILLYLAANIVREAPLDPSAAQQALAHVVLNRVKQCEKKNKSSNAAMELRRKYQFSWTNKNKEGQRDTSYSLDILKPTTFVQLSIALHSAQKAYTDHVATNDPTGGALYYHLKTMDPYPKWTQYKTALPYNFQGSHIFYLGNGGSPDKEFCQKSLIPLKSLKKLKKEPQQPLTKQTSIPSVLPDPSEARKVHIQSMIYSISEKYQ